MSTLSQLALLRGFSSKFAARPSLRTFLSVAKERQTLKNLPLDRLNDIGHTQAEVAREANRPVWDVPNHWKR